MENFQPVFLIIKLFGKLFVKIKPVEELPLFIQIDAKHFI